MSARSELNLEADFRPPGEDCRALLARISASREFQRASRLRAFLAYVVDRKLAASPAEITEVLIGLVRNSQDSILRKRNWQPTLGSTPGRFTLRDLLKLGGVL